MWRSTRWLVETHVVCIGNERACYLRDCWVKTTTVNFICPGFCNFSDISLSSPSISGLRKQWCPELVDLIERMWAHEHQDRPTMTQVVESLEELLTRYWYVKAWTWFAASSSDTLAAFHLYLFSMLAPCHRLLSGHDVLFFIYCHTFCIIQPHSKYFTSLLSPFLRLHLAYSDCFFATTLHLLGTTGASVDFSVQCILTQAICIFGLCVYQDGQNAAWYTEKNWLSTTRRTVLTNDIAETKQRTLHSCALTENHEQVYKFPCSEVD